MNVLKSKSNLVVGLGSSGLSCVRYLQQQGFSSYLYDDYLSQENQNKVKEIAPRAKLYNRENSLDEVLVNVDTLLVSPGVPLTHPLLDKAKQQNKEVIGDVEIFARLNTKPVIAVTGSNAKSTVVTMLHQAALNDGKLSILAGNIGKPVLDAINENADLYVLELSSFQLDTTYSLHSTVACILNVSPDHLDRYEDFEAYADSKQAIYSSCDYVVFNRDDVYTKPVVSNSHQVSFGLGRPETGEYGVLDEHGVLWLAYGNTKLISVTDLAKREQVDIQNALAVFAIAVAANISQSAICEMLKNFTGLAHRCELVSESNGVLWINDSKGTNIGATQAALKSYAHQSVILIAGGDAKGADVSELKHEIKTCVKQLILLGKDAAQFQQAFSEICECITVTSMQQAVSHAIKSSVSGDIVLLSPACSSLDMFSSYVERGELFKSEVLAQIEQGGYA